MASSFLRKKAEAQAKAIDQKSGAAAYGGSASLPVHRTINGGGNGAPVTRASNFLTRKAQAQAASIDQRFGSDAYGGSDWTAFDKEAGFNSWLESVNRFSDRMSGDYAKRDGVYQSADRFGKYRDDAYNDIGVMQGRANIYRDYFSNNRDLYGDEAVDGILKALDEGGGYLENARSGLGSEYDYWSQFEDETAYNDFRRISGYAELPKAEDFAEKSRYVSTYQPGTEKFNAWSGTYTNSGFGDIDYDYINRDEVARNRQALADIQSNASLLGLDNSERGEMTDEEIAIFNYIYATQSPEAAYQYIADITGELNYRRRQSAEADWSAYANEHPVGSSVFSVLESPLKGLSYLGQFADYTADGKIDQNEGYNKFSYINSAICDEVNGIVENNWGGVGSFAYQTGMSMGDFLFNTAVTGGNQALTLAIMGTGAAADTTISAKDRGLSDGQAFALGTIAGAAEVITEKISLDALLKPDWEKGALKYVLKNALAEGSEEVGSDVINLVADVLISKEKSEWQLSIDAYKAEGYTDAEALGRAIGDQAATMGLDFLGGALSGGIMSGGGSAINIAGSYATGKEFNGMGLAAEDIQAFIDEGLSSDPTTQAYKLATAAQQKLQSGGTLTNYELGALYQANARAIGAEEDGAALLEQAARDVAEGRRVSNRAASSILDNPGAMGTLTRDAGLSISDDMSKSQRREAVREAVKGFARTSAPSTVEQTTSYQQETAAAQEGPQEAGAHSVVRQAWNSKRLADALTSLGPHGQTQAQAFYNSQDQRADEYYGGFAAYYEAGVSGMDMGKVQSQYASVLNDAQKQAAYLAGQTDAAASLEAERGRVQSATVYGDEAGFIQDDHSAKLPKSTVIYYNNLARAAGVKIRMAPATGEGGANGWYSNGIISIAEDAEDPGAVVATHEITHRMQEMAPEKYRKYRDYAVSIRAAKDGTHDLIEGYKARYAQAKQNLSTEQAMDEIAADFTADLLRDVEGFRALANTERSVARKLLDAVRDFIRRVKSVFKGNKSAQNTQAEQFYGVDMATLEEAARLWGEALKATNQAARSAKTGGTDRSYAYSGDKFSMKAPVEETRDLLALHNKDENSILAAIKLGGLPMPSIAVVKAEHGHTKYGPISLVFSKDTIDPQLFRANKVYGGDAWTPTAPRVDYPVNSKKASQVEHELHRLAGDVSVAGGIFGNSTALRSMGIDDTSTRSTAELAEKLASTDTVRAAYLADQGKSLEPVKMDKVWDKFGNDTLQKVVDHLGVNTLAEIEANLETGVSVKDALGENAEAIRDILRDYYREKGEPMLRRMAVKRGWTNAEINEKRQTRIDNSMDGVSIFTLEDIVHHAWDMYQDGGATKGEIDRMATSDALRSAVDDHAVEEWIAGKLDGLLGEAGIYNGKDPYTPSGNLRSFSQLHYAYTLENIVKAMKEGQEERGGNTWGASAKTLQSVATPEYRSIQEIKADSGRLGMDEGAEYEAKLQAIDDQISSIITKVKQGNSAHSDNSFIESDIIGSILMETTKGKRTVDAIMRAFSKEGYKISSQTAQDIQAVYQAAAEMPTGYFEAKPQRAVGFDEVLAAVIPDDSSQKLRDGLEQAGVRMLEYKTGDDADRLAKVNSVEGARFSLKTVPPVKPTSDDWRPGATFDEVKAAHPTLFELAADEAEVRNPTQITGTVKSYRKIYDALQAENFDGTILDASSGLGYGTRAGREEYGYQVDDIEPFPDAKYHPMFTDYSTLDKTYDVIINNAVLNVIPQDLRDALVVKMGEMLNPGGRAYINVRGTDVRNASSKVAIDEGLMEYFISNTGSYQKGFTSKELVSYLRDALGDGFTVTPTKEFGAVSAIVTKDGPRYSLKRTGDIQRDMRALEEENDLLRERLTEYRGIQQTAKRQGERAEYWRGQTKRTTRATTDKKAVEKAARELIRTTSADMAVADIKDDLQSLYDYIASGYDGKDELTYTEARRRAEAIASRLVANAVVVDDDMYQQYGDLRSYLRTQKIRVPREMWAEFDNMGGYNELRKAYRGKLNLSSTEGAGIDQVYQELSSMYPEFFDEQRTSNPADQLSHITEVLDGIYDISEYNPFSYDARQATAGIANEIIEQFFDLPQTRATFADRQAAKLDEAKAKGRERLDRLREEKNERIAELRQQNRERVKKAIQGERETSNRKLEDLKRRHAAKDQAGRERRSARELRGKIARHAKALSQKLLHPSDKQHIPEELRGAVAAMLEAINLESQYSIDPETGKRAKNADGDPTKRTEAFRALREQYEAIAKGRTDFNGVLDPDLLENLGEVITMKDTRLADMNTHQLSVVWQTVRAIEQSISTANKLLGKSRFAGVLELAENIRQSSATKRTKGNYGGKGLGAVSGWGDRLLNLDMMNPLTFLHLFGDGGDALYRELQSARDDRTRILSETVELAQEAIGKADIEKLRRKTHTFQVEGGTLTMTTPQLMALYELSKREQAQDHIYKGGIRSTATERGMGRNKTAGENLAAALGKLEAPASGVKVTQGDMATMLSALTEEEVKIADGLQAIMQGYLAQEGNRESMKVYGYQKFTEKDYFPISSDPHQVVDKIGDVLEGGEKRPRSIAEWGSAKGTVAKANNGILLGDIFDVFAQHAVDMATYASHLGAMEDMNRVRNFTFRDGEGNRVGTMGDIIQRVAGQGGGAYLNKLLQDVSAGTAKGGVSGLAKLTANYKAASVGLNLRVALQQPTSYLRAAAAISPKYLADPRVLKKNGWSKALKNAPIALWKDWGNFEINQGRQLQDIMFNTDSKLDRARNFSMKLAGAMDSLTWGRIWNACELEVSEKRPDLARGSAAFYEAVAQRFTDVVDQTQVVDNVLGRSQIMRSGDALAKMATSYMGEPTQSYNLVYRAFRDWTQEQDNAKRTAAKKRMGRAVVALTASQFANAIAQALWDAVRDDDDRDEKYWERVLGHIMPNFAANANPVGMVPYLKDVVSVLQGYDVKRMDMAAITSFISACQNMSKAINGEGRYTLAGASANLMAEAGRIFGLPAATVKRDLVAIARSVGVETGDWYFQYQLEKALNSVGYSGNRGEFYDIAFGALKDGELDVYQRIAQDLAARGVKSGTIESAMRDRLEKALEEDPDFSLTQQARDLIAARESYYVPEDDGDEGGFTAAKLDPAAYQRYATQRAGSYREITDTLERFETFRGLDNETKNKALDAAYTLAEKTALADNSGGRYEADTKWMLWATGGEAHGVDEAEAILFKVAYDMTEGDKDESSKTVSGSKKENTLEAAAAMMPWLTDEELDYLKSNYWKE